VRDLLKVFLYPLTWSVVLLLAGILLRKRPRVLLSCAIAAVSILWIFGSGIGALTLLSTLENQYPDRSIEDTPPAQAIVVLGGAIRGPRLQHPHSALINPADRLLHTLRLYRAGKAPLILCSGGTRTGTPEALVMGRLLQEWGVPPEAILLENRSLSTRDNAVFSYPILAARGIRAILLVTSASHMPRAAATFRKAGFQVIPAPADFQTGWSPLFGFAEWLPDANYLGWSNAAIREWGSFLGYRLLGWAS
jgi:uncharacterized SAM-binding protein YcdF (DUF218 family)